MHAHNAATWRLPLFTGRLRCRGIDFHIWDATDDFSGTDMDLLFEGHRLYLHDACGKFGAVPMTITGTSHILPQNAESYLEWKDPSLAI